jgi:hypothetical protein
VTGATVRPRVCGEQILLPLPLFLGALQMETVPGAADLSDVEETPVCLLQQHDTGAHHGLVLSLAGPTTGAVWAVWTSLITPHLVVLPDCSATSPDGRRGCCRFDAHSGGHSWELDDPELYAAVQQVLGAAQPEPPN